MQKTLNWFTFLSLWFLALFAFTSNSLLAVHHILLILPGLYYFLTLFKKQKLSKSAIFLGVMIFFVICSVLLNWTDISKPLKNLVRIKYFALGFLAIYAFKGNRTFFLSKNKIKILIKAFLISTSFASLVGIISLFTGYNFIRMRGVSNSRTQGLYGMTITYGHGIALVCILLATLIFFRKEIRDYISQKWLWIAFTINTAALFLNYTRGAMLGFAFGLVALTWFKSKKLFVIISVSITLALTLAVWITKDSGSQSRYLMKFKSNTNTIRVSQIITAFYIFKDNPFFGVGFRNYQAKSKIYKEKYNITLHKRWSGHAHNNYLEILAGCGIFAFIFLLLWHGFWLYESFGSRTLYPKLFGPFLVAWIVSGMTQSSIIDGENMFLVMGIYALSQIKINSSSQAPL